MYIKYSGDGQYKPRDMSANTEYKVLKVTVDHVNYHNKNLNRHQRLHKMYFVITGNNNKLICVNAENCTVTIE